MATEMYFLHQYNFAKAITITFIKIVEQDLPWAEFEHPWAFWIISLMSLKVEVLNLFTLKTVFYCNLLQVDGRTGEEVTFNKLILTVKKLALGLSNLGLVKGDLVGIYAHNSLEFVYALLASMMNGAVPALVNPCYKTCE